jgi:hypothetical protein
MKIIVLPGVRYEGETDAQADERERLAREHNAKMEALEKDWERQRQTPMRSMVEWAKQRGIV